MNKNVKFGKNKILFVDLGEYTVQVENPFDYVPDNVEVIQFGNGGKYFVKGYEPKPIKITKDDEEEFEPEEIIGFEEVRLNKNKKSIDK